MSIIIPVSLIDDSELLLALREDDEGFAEKLSDERLFSAIKTVSPMYENAGYECALEEDALVLLIEELSYLGCARLEEVLVMTHFKGESWQCNVICRLNEDLQRFVGSMKYESTEIRTYICNGMLPALKKYLEYHPFVSNSDFIIACANGNLSVAELLYGLGGVDIHADNEAAFEYGCGNGHLSVAQWLYGLGGVNIHSKYNTAFHSSCCNGHLLVAQWLYGLGGVNIHLNYDRAFRYACENSHLSVAEWLFGLGGVNIHFGDDYAFRFACGNGHLLVAQWLYGLEIKDYNISSSFLYSCCNGHLSVAQWLYGLGGVNIHANNEYAFRCACGNGHLSVAQWLHGLGGVDIHADNEAAYRYAFFNCHLSIYKWLKKLKEDFASQTEVYYNRYDSGT